MVVKDLIADLHTVGVQPEQLHLVLRVQHANRDSFHGAGNEHRSIALLLAVKIVVAHLVNVSSPLQHFLLYIDFVAAILMLLQGA